MSGSGSGSISPPYNPFTGGGANNSNSSGGAPPAVLNLAIFSNNLPAASKLINEDQLAAQEASQSVQNARNLNRDPQVEDITREKIRELTNAAEMENTQEENEEASLDHVEEVTVAEAVAAEAAAEAAAEEPAEAPAEAPASLQLPPHVREKRITALPPLLRERLEEAKKEIDRIAQEKEKFKLRRLEKIKNREDDKARKAAVAAATKAGFPQTAEEVVASQTQGTPQKREGQANRAKKNPDSLARATAAAAKENSNESLRISFSGMNDKSALNHLWPYSDDECCYLCGFPTHSPTGSFPDRNHTIKLLHGNRSPEHVIPMTAGGAAYIGILKRGDDFSNGPLKNLLKKELRPSHYWCNEVKQNMLFITWPINGRISFNAKVVSDFLYLLYYGSSTGTRFFDENYCKVYCEQDNKLYPHLVHYFCKTRGITFDTWHAESMRRIRYIIEDIIQTIYILAPEDPSKSENTFKKIQERFSNYGQDHWNLKGKEILKTENICYRANFTEAGIITRGSAASANASRGAASANASRGAASASASRGAASAGGSMEEINNARLSVTIPGLKLSSNFARAAFNHRGHQFAENAITRGRFITSTRYNRNRSRSRENKSSNKTTPAYREGFINGYDGRSKNLEQFNKRGDYFMGYTDGKSRKHQEENLLGSRRRTRKTRKRNRKNRKTRKV